MKKLIFILLFFVVSLLYTTAAVSIQYNINNIEQVNTIKMHVPGIIKLYSNDDNYIDVRGNDNYIINHLIYEVQDSVLNIKLKTGTFYDWNVQPEDLIFRIGIKSDIPNIITSNDLILSNLKQTNKCLESNHETENN